MSNTTIRGHVINHTDDQDRFWAEVSHSAWEETTFNVLDKFFENGGIFMDIGAWNGVLSLYAASKGATCYSLEPDNKAFSLLTENSKLNQDLKSKITTFNIGISDKNGFDTLMSATGNWGDSMSSILDQGGDGKHTQSINTVSLSTFFEKSQIDISTVSLIKIDVEGAEVKILPQAKDLLAIYRPPVYLSLHPFWFPDFEANTNEIADVIFPIYQVLLNGEKEITRHEFIEVMSAKVGVDILLQPRKEKVALIIPVFNRPDYLIACLLSINNLTVKPYQLIIVDDASDDAETVSVINGYDWANIARHSHNTGVKGALLTGTYIAFEQLGCDYAIVLDADAIVKPNMIQELVELHKTHGCITSGFNCGYKQAIREEEGVLFKDKCNGISMCFDHNEYVHYVYPALNTPSGDWDNILSAMYARHGKLFAITTPSLVQHIGEVSTMNHYPPDTAQDF